MMNQRERAALDRHITGNYGEDQFREDPVLCEKCGEGALGTCPRCQRPSEDGERYCSRCDWCEACGRSGGVR